MENKFLITDIVAVFSGENRAGVIDNSNKRREYDGLVYFLSGEVEYIFSDHSFTARSGSVAYLPRGSSYVMNIKEGFSYVCVNFLFYGADMRRGAVLSKGIPPTVHNDLLRIGSLLGSGGAGCGAESLSILYHVFALLERASRGYVQSDTRATDAASYIRMNYADPELTVGNVASAVGVSEPHLRRIFRAQTGTSPVRYIRSVRMDAARNLLIDTNLHVAEIATAVGYADQYYFIKDFTAHTGISPGKFRRGGSM